MIYYVVNVDNFSDAHLCMFGWVLVDEDSNYGLYWNPRYNEHQPISKMAPRTLILDDWDDVEQMGANVVQRFRYP